MVFDALCSVVPTPEAFGAAEATLARMRGYQQHFSTPGPIVPLRAGRAELDAAVAEADTKGRGMCPSEAEFDRMLDDAGVTTAAVYTEHYGSALGVHLVDNDTVAGYVARQPDRLIGLAGADPWLDDAATETERAITDLGLQGIVISPFKQGLLPTDPRMARIFAVCERLGVPAFIHSGINWWVDTTYDLGHPRHLDALASAFPHLKIVALHCGWPWVEDMVMIAWRHPNVYLDISAHRPKHMTVGESGWGPLLYWGNRVLRDRVVFGSTWTLVNQSIKTLADEVRGLPLKDDVIEQWLGGNALRLFDRA